MSESVLHDAEPDELARVVEATHTPAHLDTPLGSFEFTDGVPTSDSAARLYEALDFMRGVEVYLNSVSGASLVAMRSGFRSIGLTEPNQVGYTEPRVNSGSYFLTPNTETTYGSLFIDLKRSGPLVIEPPTQSLCVVDDFWFRYVADMGIAGPDKGEGGKYLFLPPATTATSRTGTSSTAPRPSPTGWCFARLVVSRP